jgi:hypothetical protein
VTGVELEQQAEASTVRRGGGAAGSRRSTQPQVPRGHCDGLYAGTGAVQTAAHTTGTQPSQHTHTLPRRQLHEPVAQAPRPLRLPATATRLFRHLAALLCPPATSHWCPPAHPPYHHPLTHPTTPPPPDPRHSPSDRRHGPGAPPSQRAVATPGRTAPPRAPSQPRPLHLQRRPRPSRRRRRLRRHRRRRRGWRRWWCHGLWRRLRCQHCRRCRCRRCRRCRRCLRCRPLPRSAALRCARRRCALRIDRREGGKRIDREKQRQVQRAYQTVHISTLCN